MEPYAVIETGGKQYRVKAGDTLNVERLKSDIGQTVELTPVLALSNGAELAIGTPEVAGAKVSAEVVDHIRGPKLVAFKKKRRKGYKKKTGHRQDLTVLKVRSVGGE
ncbi:MAG: 50S ribosomal protein L21 [Kiritimatiellae bacterium]|nr:50S ribosomal protein L21 [Kiritimatiellia bacterium]